MTRYTFQAFPYSVTKTFTCPSCGKTGRKRTFRAECTVNPFNKKEDGTVRTSPEVRQQSREMATEAAANFMKEPLCKACEDALTYLSCRDLQRRRIMS